jgi:putative membrane protein
MKQSFCIAITLMVLFAAQACNDTRRAKNYNDRTLVDDTGISLIKNGVESGNAEVKLSLLAERQSQNVKVIDFAKMMITDHTAVGNELKKIAANKKVNTSDTLTMEHLHLITSLSKKSGAEFDKEYMQAMVVDHKRAIEVFKAAANNTDASVNHFAGKTIPKLEGHLEEANKIFASLK